MPELLPPAFFPSRSSRRLETEPSFILDLDEATGAARLTTADLFGSKPRNGLFCGNNPVNHSDPNGLGFASFWNKIVTIFSNNGTQVGTNTRTAYGAPTTGSNIPDTQERTYLPGGGYDRIDHSVVNGYTDAGSFTSDGTSIPRATAVDGGGGIGDFLGKIWTLPNTIIGAVAQVLLTPFAIANGGEFHFANNAIQLTHVPFGGGAITFGNSQLYFGNTLPSTFGAYENDNINIGFHEQGHTYQYQQLGIFFLPAYFLSGHPFSLDNPFEAGAQDFAAKYGPTPPVPPGG